MNALSEDTQFRFIEFYQSVRDDLIFQEPGQPLRFFLHFNCDSASATPALLKADGLRPKELPQPAISPEQTLYMRRMFCFKFVGAAERETPMLFVKLLASEIDAGLKLFPPDEIEALLVAFMEYLIRTIFPAILQTTGKEVHKINIFVDLIGLSIPSLIANPRILGLAKRYAKVLQELYPELMDKIVIFNAGVMAWTAFQMFSPFFPKKLIANTKIFTGKADKDVFQPVDPGFLPEEYGGAWKGALAEVPEQGWFRPFFIFAPVE